MQCVTELKNFCFSFLLAFLKKMPRYCSNDYIYFKAWPNRGVLMFIESLTRTTDDSTNFNTPHKLIDVLLEVGLLPSTSLSSLDIDLETLRQFVPDTHPLTPCSLCIQF